MNKKEFEKSRKRAIKNIESYPYVIFICFCYICLSGLFLNIFEFFSGYILGIGILTFMLAVHKRNKAKRWLKANS